MATDKVVDELKRIGVDTAEAFISITVHRTDGRLVPTLTVFGDGLTSEQGQKITRAMVDAVRAALMPQGS